MELNAHELRIGNLFQERNSREVIMVMELSATTIGFSGSFPKGWQAEPICLTEEWLLKFGFEKVGGSIYKDIGSIEIGITGNKRFYIQIRAENVTLEIKYVHQLQNLYFALTGEELQLKP